MPSRCSELVAVFVAASLLATSCSGASSESEGTAPPMEVGVGGETHSDSLSTADSEDARSDSSARVDSAGLAVLDETIPEGPHGDVFGDPSLAELACWSDIAFIGRITGYAENLLTAPGGSEWNRPLRDVYDGMVFSVDELLLGDVGSGERPTIAFWALVVNEDGSPHSRANAGLFRIFRPGVVQRHSESGDQPRYLVYGKAAGGGLSGPPGVFHLSYGHYSVALVLADGRLESRLGTRGTAEDARAAARARCVSSPLPTGTRDIWRDVTGLSLNMGERLWVNRLTRVCNAALGPELDRPVWDQDAALALAEDFAGADGLRPDLPPESRERFVMDAAGALWLMVVHRAAPDGRSVCWDRAPTEFLEAGPPAMGGWELPLGLDSSMTEWAFEALGIHAERRLWLVDLPLPSGTREIWWQATGLRTTVDEQEWTRRLNQACNTPYENPLWDRAAAVALAEEFIVEDGGEPSSELIEIGADALWQMTAVPPSGACPWHYPAEAFEPEFFEQMEEARRTALSR